MVSKTGIGIGNGIPFGNMASGKGKPYLSPEVKEALKAVVIAYGKTNNDSDRATVKNLVDPDNPFVISNAAYNLNSGYGKYDIDFTIFTNKFNVDSLDAFKVILDSRGNLVRPYSTLTENYPSWKGKVTFNNSNFTGILTYDYRDNSGKEQKLAISQDGIYQFPICYNTETGDGTFTGLFNRTNSAVTIEQIPSYQGAFVTDGVDDLITSTKTVQDMLGGSNECTVLSMMWNLTSDKDTYNNQIRPYESGFIRSRFLPSSEGKLSISGYTIFNINYNDNVLQNNVANVDSILGDKADFNRNASSGKLDGKFSVEGYLLNNGGYSEQSQVAWYWTIIANKVLTTDEINQVIAYFNLDRTLKPDILCNVKKQGITNENHAEFGDRLIDFSGNGRDIQLNNLAWDGDSGIGKYNYPNWKVNVTQGNKYARIVYYDSINGTYSANFKGITDLYKSYGLSIEIRVNRANTIDFHSIKEDGIYTITPPDDTTSMDIRFGGEDVYNASCNITITQIPSHAGALCLDGVDDFGKVTGMPVYKDYTVVTDREIFANTGAILSKNNPGAFVETDGNSVYSFGQGTSGLNFISTRSISYLSKYSYCGQSITAGAAEDGTDMWLGTIRDNDSCFFNGAIYSLMSFPYSMSEFLIERQLKKHKLGTLYPDMVEFRPIVKSNAEYSNILAFIGNEGLVAGNYYPSDSLVTINVYTKEAVDEVTSLKVNGVDFNYDSSSGTRHSFKGYITKSPQKIDITIDEYIRYEDIVQPYPEMWVITQNAKKVSWGDKLKVGSEFGYNSKVNLLSGLYSTANSYYNGKVVKTGNVLKVEKQMVFACDYSWIGGTNEPKCILSPSRLRIPNSSYKILGYIPDLTGKGNHGKINNSAYAGISGANGYLLDFKTFTTGNSSLVNIKDDSRIEVININKEKSTTFVNLNKSTSISLSSWKIKVTGMKSGDTLGYYYSESTDATLRSKFDIKSDGIYSLPSSIANSNNIGGISFDVVAGADSAYRIEQIGEYEGAYCLDGVDDFVTIPTLSSGGKQVLMKVNSRKYDTYMYDQRNLWSQYLAIVSAESRIAYEYSNQDGKTYIDGILNEHIIDRDLLGITHNITVTNNSSGNQYPPNIGTSFAKRNFAQMALFDFMLFDEISTDEEIKDLNEYVGIEGNTE